jgi:hypothetical protein
MESDDLDLEKQYLAEYGYLRQEILDADRAIYQVLGFVLAASGLLFARAFDLENPAQGALILAIIQVFALPCHLLLRANRKRIWRIATYLRIFVEPNLPGVQWETDLAALRAKGAPKTMARFSTRVIGTESLVMVMISVAAVLAETLILLSQSSFPEPLEGNTYLAVYAVNLPAAAYYLFDRKHWAVWSANSERAFAEGWLSIQPDRIALAKKKPPTTGDPLTVPVADSSKR